MTAGLVSTAVSTVGALAINLLNAAYYEEIGLNREGLDRELAEEERIHAEQTQAAKSAETATSAAPSPERRYCPTCGKEAPAEARFCDSCGAKL